MSNFDPLLTHKEEIIPRSSLGVEGNRKVRTGLDTILERCRLSLGLRYKVHLRPVAESLLADEVRFIQKYDQKRSLRQVVEVGDQLRQQTASFHLIGSGGSSLVLFLLGVSEVDPIHYRTCYQRLWFTASGGAPRFQFVATPKKKSGIECHQNFEGVTVHPMTALETIPARLENRLSLPDTGSLDALTMAALRAGHTDAIFQLESDQVRWLLSQLCPRRIEDLAIVTALEQVGHTRPGLVAQFLESCQVTRTRKHITEHRTQIPLEWSTPFLFQETIIGALMRDAGLTWEEAYRFILATAKSRTTEQHELWGPVRGGLERRYGAESERLFRKLLNESPGAVCWAHHVANAITSYKAAYFRVHHRSEFEQVREQLMSVKEGA